jgi:carboxyl-terminal processing protease
MKKISIFIFAIFISFALTSKIEQARAKDNSDGKIFDSLKLFTDVISIVQRDYVKQVDSRKLIEGAIRGMITELDPHSAYLDPDYFKDLQAQTDGEFGGLGIEISVKDGLLVVVTAMEGSPAEKAGLKSGDAIVKIDGKFAKGLSFIEAIKRLRGPKGSSVTVTVQRSGRNELLDFKVVRDKIEVKSVRGRYLDNEIGYIKVNQFVKRSSEEIEKHLKSIKQQVPGEQLKGLILDFRNNPGGLLTQAVAIADLFIKSGVIVYTDGRIKEQKKEFFASGRGTEPDYPIVVLINGGSASASEIVAAALKDHGRAVVVGTQSFGKGSVQTVMPLENGWALSLTTALYYTKSGRSIQSTGVVPDIEISDGGGEDTRGGGITIREGDLPGAIANPNNIKKNGELNDASSGAKGTSSTSSLPGEIVVLEKVDLKQLFERDRQLNKAYEILKTFEIFGAKLRS